MAKKPHKTKSKRRSTPKSNAKQSGSKPLVADAAWVRTATPSTNMNTTPSGTLSSVAPALPLIAMMGRLMGAYAELPARLSRCRHPMDLWLEQVRFVQRVFGGPTAPASSRV
jgi:hypothetical protein